MKLHTLRINNFRAIKFCDIPFENPLGRVRPLIVLAGPNGCGKTSILHAIVNALRGPVGYRTDDVPKPSYLDIHQEARSSGFMPRREEPQISVHVGLSLDEDEVEAIPHVLEDMEDMQEELTQDDEEREIEENATRDASAFPPDWDRRISILWDYPPGRRSNGSPKPYWHVSRLDPSWKALRWLRARVLAIQAWKGFRLRSRDLIDRIGWLRLFPQDRNLRSRVIGEQDEPDRKDELSVWGILDRISQYASDRIERAKPLDKEENFEKRIQDQFKRICAPREYLGFGRYNSNDPYPAPHFKHGESVYPLNMAASGEQVIIDYITRLTYPSPTNHSIVLIDEPEIHLHPSWIRQLYVALPQIGVDNQYIVTTHSPELRALAAEDGSLIDLGELGK